MTPSIHNEATPTDVGATTRTTVLVVDDHELFRERLARAFRTRGFDVRTAGSVSEALAAAREDAPELAVVDLSLPDGSGLHVLRELLVIEPATRVLILTGYGSVASAVDAMRIGAATYLQKPADADAILDAFERAEAPVEIPEANYTPPTLDRVEWEHIQRVLADCGGNISEAARRLKLHRRSLQRKLQRWAPPGD